MFSLKNKTAVITGGGSGIGKATAMLFSRHGANVHIIDVSKDATGVVVQEIQEAGGNASAQVCNVADQQQVKNIFSQIGSIDILVNSAGVSHIGKAHTTNEDDFDRIFNVNVKGVYNCIHEVLPIMLQKGKGVILNLASVASSVGIADRFAYSMSKGAVAAMTLSVAKDYVNDGIRCNSVSPARVHTSFVDGFLKQHYPGQEEEMFQKLSKTQPIGRMANPEEIAKLVLYLCSDEASFITGSDYPIDGGFIKINN